jgi:hypothetical protein
MAHGPSTGHLRLDVTFLSEPTGVSRAHLPRQLGQLVQHDPAHRGAGRRVTSLGERPDGDGRGSVVDY